MPNLSVSKRFDGSKVNLFHNLFHAFLKQHLMGVLYCHFLKKIQNHSQILKIPVLTIKNNKSSWYRCCNNYFGAYLL